MRICWHASRAYFVRCQPWSRQRIIRADVRKRWTHLVQGIALPFYGLPRRPNHHYLSGGIRPLRRGPGGAAGEFEVVPNGIDIHQFSNSPEARLAARSSLGVAGGSFIWLAVGRLVEQKDYSTLLAAVRTIPECDFQVLIAGQGPLQDLCGRIRRAWTNRKIRFLGTTENMRQLYAAADGFVCHRCLKVSPLPCWKHPR